MCIDKDISGARNLTYSGFFLSALKFSFCILSCKMNLRCSIVLDSFGRTTIEDFIIANTRMVIVIDKRHCSLETWECLVCQKLFVGQKFVWKHMFRKHASLIDEVKREVSNMFISERALYWACLLWERSG